MGVHFLYKEDKFLNEKNISTDASIYYKLKLFEDNDFVISAQPKILMSKSKKLKEDFLGEVSLLMGMSKNIRSVTIFNQNVFSFGHSINNIDSRKMYYNFSTCEGIKFKNGIMLTSFTKYHIRQNYGYVYGSSVYEQLGIAKIINFGKENKNSITTQIGYFWDRSLSNKKYKISGISFSTWLDV
ncbi:MAG: TonB-dependent receptor [Rickettsia helvetica]|uniref:TonB-dependent receptor n=1 Tax=Rickettsia helvetica TaxID=35789 RepID=A0ABM9N9T5_RICHE